MEILKCKVTQHRIYHAQVSYEGPTSLIKVKSFKRLRGPKFDFSSLVDKSYKTKAELRLAIIAIASVNRFDGLEKWVSVINPEKANVLKTCETFGMYVDGVMQVCSKLTQLPIMALYTYEFNWL